MKLRTDVFDLWVFRRDQDQVRYLLLHTSQEKADKWFGGGRFWQIPGGLVADDEEVVGAMQRILEAAGQSATSLWAVEHTYTIYNRRRNNLEIIPVFAAEVEGERPIPLTWEHSESRWLTAAECQALIKFRGLLDGLEWTRMYVTENENPGPEFRLA